MKFDLAVTVREKSGKGAARQLRRSGKVPAVLYGQGECLLLTIEPEPLRSEERRVGKECRSRWSPYH